MPASQKWGLFWRFEVGKGCAYRYREKKKMTMVIFFLAISLGTALFYFEPVRAPTFEKQA